MDTHQLIEGVLRWLGLVILFTFHEFGHAWMAMKCGDNTARDEGRVSLNPLVHLDLLGSVILPLIFMVMGTGLLGWARPVPVNHYNLRDPRRDDLFVTFAGPWMNLLIALVLVGLARVGLAFGSSDMVYYCFEVAELSLFLFFFNLLPIPPLDGSHLVRAAIGMSYGTYAELSRYGIMALVLIMQIRPIWQLLNYLTGESLRMTARLFGFEL